MLLYNEDLKFLPEEIKTDLFLELDKINDNITDTFYLRENNNSNIENDLIQIFKNLKILYNKYIDILSKEKDNSIEKTQEFENLIINFLYNEILFQRNNNIKKDIEDILNFFKTNNSNLIIENFFKTFYEFSKNKKLLANKKDVNEFIKFLFNKNLKINEKQKEIKELHNIMFSDLFEKIEKFEEIEFAENFEKYIQIKFELGEDKDLINILNNILINKDKPNTIKFKKLFDDMKRFIITKDKYNIMKDNNNQEYYNLHSAQSGIADVQFFYFKKNSSNNQYEWFSKSASITKSGKSTFESNQNNTHSIKTLIRLNYLNKYIQEIPIENLDKFKKVKSIEDFKNLLPNFKKKNLTVKLNLIDNLSEEILFAFEQNKLSFNEIEEYLEIHFRYKIDVIKTNQEEKEYLEKDKTLNYYINNNIKKNNNKTIDEDIKCFLKDKEKYISNIIKSKKSDISIEYKERLNNAKKIIQERIKDNQENYIEYYSNQLLRNPHNHEHNFTIISNEIVLNGFKTKTDIKLTHLIVFFSHIKNELSSLDKLKPQFDLQEYENYFNNIFLVHQNYKSKIIYTTKTKILVKEMKFEELNNLITNPKKIEEIFDEFILIIKQELKKYKLNKILTTNFHNALDILLIMNHINLLGNNSLELQEKLQDKIDSVKHLISKYELGFHSIVEKVKELEKKDIIIEEERQRNLEKDNIIKEEKQKNLKKEQVIKEEKQKNIEEKLLNYINSELTKENKIDLNKYIKYISEKVNNDIFEFLYLKHFLENFSLLNTNNTVLLKNTKEESNNYPNYSYSLILDIYILNKINKLNNNLDEEIYQTIDNLFIETIKGFNTIIQQNKEIFNIDLEDINFENMKNEENKFKSTTKIEPCTINTKNYSKDFIKLLNEKNINIDNFETILNELKSLSFSSMNNNKTNSNSLKN